jgi:uncharacterized protein (DUF302 family)
MEIIKIKARGEFETLSGKIANAIVDAGFTIVGKLQLQKEQHQAHLKYEVMSLDLPRISAQMLALCPLDGIILPSCVSFIETYPGEMTIAIANPSEQYVRDNLQLHQLATEVTNLLQDVVGKFAHEGSVIPDLVTSWD